MSVYFWRGGFYSTKCKYGTHCDLLTPSHADDVCRSCRKARRKLEEKLSRLFPERNDDHE